MTVSHLQSYFYFLCKTFEMKKNLTLLLFSCIVFSAFSQTKIEPNPKQSWKDPAGSFLLSTIIPGTGQMYNDQTYLGLGIFGSEALFFGLGGMFVALPDYSSGYYDSDSRFKIVGFTFIGMGSAIHLAQMIYAPIVSHRKNKANGFVYKSKKQDLNMAFMPTPMGFSMKVEF